MVAAHPEVRFVFAGEGRDHEMLEELTRQHGVPDHFTFLGQVEDVQGLLSAVDLIAIPSRFEGLPWSPSRLSQRAFPYREFGRRHRRCVAR